MKKVDVKGFTLMEVIGVLGITIIITLIIYQTFLISQKTFAISSEHLEITQNGRIFLDRITRELRQAWAIATPLPADKNIEGFPPPTEIMFQDGHGVPDVEYIKYYLDGNQLKRQRIIYFFQTEPATHVFYDAKDDFGNSPQSQILDERTIAEYINQLILYGNTVTYIEINLSKNNSTQHFITGIWGRNIRP